MKISLSAMMQTVTTILTILGTRLLDTIAIWLR
jgi:hypothetical protein